MLLPNGVQIYKWPYALEPTEELVKQEMEKFGYEVYDLQTVTGWFKRSDHAHDYEEIRAAVRGTITFHFQDFPLTIEAGDVLVIPAGVRHTVISHNGKDFAAFKGNAVGKREVTEYGDGHGSIEHLQKTAAQNKPTP